MARVLSTGEMAKMRRMTVNDQIHDALAVLATMRDSRTRSGIYVETSKLRHNSINEVADRQLQAGRFKDERSARNTIHDALTKRLKPDISRITQFDALANQWIQDGSMKLKDILLKHAHSASQRADITRFFDEK